MNESNLIPVVLDEVEFTVERFRSEHVFESFSDYATRFLLPIFSDYLPEAADIHCMLSGYPIYRLVDTELALMIHGAVIALRLDRYDRELEIGDSDTASAFEMIWDHISVQVVNLSRRAPSISYSKDRLILGYMPMSRQISILLNMLMYNSGLFKNRKMSYDDIYDRNMAAIQMARVLDESDLTKLETLHAALVELDAKYAIKELVFVRKEVETLERLRSMESPNFPAILDFVLKMINYRDKHESVVEDGTQLWTNKVYTDAQFNAVDRRDYSNIFKLEPVKKAESGKKRGRPAKEKTAEVVAKETKKANQKAAFTAAFADMFKAD